MTAVKEEVRRQAGDVNDGNLGALSMISTNLVKKAMMLDKIAIR